jgi:DNA-binding MarR family transcriptional regulator
MGYLEQERSVHDRRSVSVRLADKSKPVVKSIRDLEEYNAAALIKQEVSAEEIDSISRSLRRIKRTWTDYIHYGGT